MSKGKSTCNIFMFYFPTLRAYCSNLECKNQVSTSLVRSTMICSKHTIQTLNDHYKTKTLSNDNCCKVDGRFYVALATIEYSMLACNKPDMPDHLTIFV